MSVETSLPEYWVLLYKTEHAGNLGAVARLAANFAVRGLVLVDPQCEIGPEARARAKHGVSYLYDARVVSSLKEAAKLFDFMVATSALVSNEHGLTRPAVSVRELVSRLPHGPRIAIGFGPESTGFVNEDLEYFDLLCTIPTNPLYPTLNLSHAVSIVLYEIFVHSDLNLSPSRLASPSSRHRLISRFSTLVDLLGSSRPPHHDMKDAFKNLVNRAFISSKETAVLLGTLLTIGEEINANFASIDKSNWENYKQTHAVSEDPRNQSDNGKEQ